MAARGSVVHDTTPTEQPGVVEIVGLRKDYGYSRAIDDVHLDLRPGEIHGLVGENGAGKSTVLKILSGVLPAGSYSGTIKRNGQVLAYRSVREAQAHGIFHVSQELEFAPQQMVVDHLMLGATDSSVVVSWNRAARRYQSVIDSYALPVSLWDQMGLLSVAERQVLEITKALSTRGSVLLLDEATASLSENEVADLFRRLGLLRDQGAAILYVTHRLSELYRIADRVTVLRDGRNAGEFNLRSGAGASTRGDIVAAIVGEKQRTRRVLGAGKAESRAVPGREVSFSFPVGKGGGVDDSVTVRGGQIVVLYGQVGGGVSEALRACAGMDKQWSRVVLSGRGRVFRTPQGALRAGLVYVPADRAMEGNFLMLSIRDNIGVRQRAAGGSVLRRAERESLLADSRVEAFRIRCRSSEQEVSSLSGGNQQKVLLAACDRSGANVVIFDEPTRGVDVGAREEIYQFIGGLASRGAAVLVGTTDVEEAMRIAGLIVVVKRRTVVARLEPRETTEQEIVDLVCS